MARSVVVFRSPRRERCLEMQAALGAVGLASALLHAGGGWMLAVDEHDRAAALEELEAYARENARPPLDEPAPAAAPLQPAPAPESAPPAAAPPEPAPES